MNRKSQIANRKSPVPAWLPPSQGLAVLGGLLLAAAFPKVGIAGLAWIAPGLVAAAAFGKEGGERFRIGYIGFLAYYLASLYWLLLIPYRWHGIPLAPATGWLALSGVLALFPAGWVWLVSGSFMPVGDDPTSFEAPSTASNGSRNVTAQGGIGARTPPSACPNPPDSWARASAFLSCGRGRPRFCLAWDANRPWNWGRRTLWALCGAAAWVAFEMVLARLLGGFPWDFLGVSQYRMLPLVQIASITGVYGVSFLIVWFSLSLVSAGVLVLRRPAQRMTWMGEVFLPVLVVAIVFNFGFRRIRSSPNPTRTIRVTLVQPSIPQTVIWNPENDEARFQGMIRLSEQALTNRTDLLIWPESAIPNLLRYDQPTLDAVTGLARRYHVWMIVGADDAQARPHAVSPQDVDYFNASFLINPQGHLMARYVKRRLVIFGEYIPLARWLPFLKWFTPIQGGFTPGHHAVQFKLSSLGVQTSVLICFEDVFPQLGRSSTQRDTDFLVNITNDGWFGHGAEQWQHATTALFRAVENRVPLIRCTNDGLTCWIDAYGRIRRIFLDQDGTIYGAGFITVQIPIVPPEALGGRTFYTRHGDLFGWCCVAITCLLLAARLLRARRCRILLSRDRL